MSSKEDFHNLKTDELKQFLKERGIPLSEGGKQKRKEELASLCENARAMKQPRIDPPFENNLSELMKEKLRTDNGEQLPNPKDVTGWTYNFSNIPEFTFGQLYNYFIGKDDEYTEESLRAFKSLTGFKLYRDGHVFNLQYHSVNTNYCFFKFSVKPTDRSKTEGGLLTYNGFIVMRDNADIHSAYCECKGGIDGLCKHVSAALFDLQAIVCNNIITTCTSQQCVWKRRERNDGYAVLLDDLNVVKAEFGKEEKTYFKPHNFDPRCVVVNQESKRESLRKGLQELCPDAVALMFLEEPQLQVTDQNSLDKHMNSNVNVEQFETVENVSVYTMMEYADIFKSVQLQDSRDDVEYYSEETVLKFMDFIEVDKDQIDVICDKTIHQGQSQFWFNQRAGRITASNFYKVCHLRESTDKTNTVKLLMNYCPMINVPDHLEWGHEKEGVSANTYYKKLSKKHEGVFLKESGLVINQKWPYLGASPDRIRFCKCHGKVLVECKSMFAKKNLLPSVAAADKLQKTADGVMKLKEETSWYYQIQGQMAITGISNTDLIIYTNKKILIISVPFNQGFWENAILGKLKLFFLK